MELIVAITENNVIGFEGDMPWHLPADLANFKSMTSGHAVLMGRKTWESIGKPLPNRMNIVLTRQLDLSLEGAIVVHSIDDAICKAGNEQLFVIGGGEIYEIVMEHATTIHVTRIHTSIEGDTQFPQIDTDEWTLQQSEICPADEKNAFAMTFETWQRVPSPSNSLDSD